jgi:succinate-semialdehyde dehydrogenase / glutarate-semialdehyde dehydrogenase
VHVYQALTDAELESRLSKASHSFRKWKTTPVSQRAQLLLNCAGILEAEKANLGKLITHEMGKTLASAVAEAEKCALACRFYAENAERFLRDEEVVTNASRSFIAYQPLGPVLAIMPWNFPFWQVFRFAAPALMAGNVVLLKHSSNVPQCALAIENILERAGFPEGVFQTLLIEADDALALLQDQRVAAVTLTGSEAAGKSVAAFAGSLIKKSVLELGGSDPFIVLSSSPVDSTVTAAVKARTICNGQSCIAAKRIIVSAKIYDEFEAKFVASMKALRVGCPMRPETELGPLATPKIVEETQAQVDRAVAAGARIQTGGRPIDRPGYYFEPTVLTDVPRGSAVSYEEFFGPVALLFRVETADEAIELANDSIFGLGASVWTQDEEEQTRFSKELEVGQVFINSPVMSDPRLPFGGVKRSGYGRELAELGMREFTNIKTVWIK